MGLMDDVKQKQASKTRGGNRCQMCALSDPETSELGPGDAADLAKVLEDGSIFATTVIEVLADRGIQTTASKVGNHRRIHLGGGA